MMEWLKNSADIFIRYGTTGLFAVSFAESSFFPVPPDLILIPLAILNPNLALWYAFITTFGSVLGGVFGHYIGKRFGKPVLNRLVSRHKMQKVEQTFAKYGGWAVAISGFTPVPYKVFTIASGACGISRFTLVIASVIGRGARFFLEAAAVMLLGPQAKVFLENELGLITFALTMIIICGYLLFRLTNKGSKIRELLLCFTARIRQFVNQRFGPLGDFGNYLLAGITFAFLSILLFSDLAEDLDELDLFDSAIIHFIGRFNSPSVTQIMKIVTAAGSPAFLLLIACVVSFILYIRKRHFWDALMVIAALGGGSLLNYLLKLTFQRPRPHFAALVDASGYSFPSGHAMVSAVFYGFLAYLIWLNIRNLSIRYCGAIGLGILILLIGVSRIYLGVHYPSDVLAGFAAGGFWLAGCILGHQAIRHYKISVSFHRK